MKKITFIILVLFTFNTSYAQFWKKKKPKKTEAVTPIEKKKEGKKA